MSFIFQLLSRNIRKDLVNRSALLWPLIADGDEAPGVTFSVATSDPEAARAAVAAGARAILVSVDDDFAPADRMAVALSVTEAELGLADGAVSLILEIAGPADFSVVNEATLDRAKAQYNLFAGKKRPAAGFAPGIYHARFTVRDSSGVRLTEEWQAIVN